jgi:hypothetical protein
MDNLRSTVATKILGSIPPNVKPIDYLMKALNISRESVYRRIRGDISFALEEIVKLSVDLKFSVDELIIKDMHSRVFLDIHITHDQDPSDMYVTMFEQSFQSIFDMPVGKDTHSTMILNHVPYGLIIFFNHLFKFSYYRWMHQNQESSLNYFYSDINLPEKLICLQQKVLDNLKKIKNKTIIFDTQIFKNLIWEVQYYHKRKLIDEVEFYLIREDLLGLIDLVENIAQTGYCADSKYNFYLSSLKIESSSRYIKCDDQVKSQFFINSIEPIIISDPNLCFIHKKWLDSMRKYATLITQSNEILQVKYFHKQRSYIEEINEMINIHLL